MPAKKQPNDREILIGFYQVAGDWEFDDASHLDHSQVEFFMKVILPKKSQPKTITIHVDRYV